MEYKYYSTQRPVGPGTYPKANMVDFENFDDRTYIDSIGRAAWGVIYYSEPISAEMAAAYELVAELKEVK